MCALVSVHENLGMYENKVVFVKKKCGQFLLLGTIVKSQGSRQMQVFVLLMRDSSKLMSDCRPLKLLHLETDN